MEIKDQDKFEEIAASLHDREGDGLTEHLAEDSDFIASARIYNLRGRVKQLALLSHQEDAWKKIRTRLPDKKSIRREGRIVFIRYAAVFLVLVTLAGITGRFISKPLSFVKKEEKLTEIISSVGETKEVLLPDGTTVWLGTNSKLGYNRRFGKRNREVFFYGEALFHVEKNETLPFSVILDDEASITVHGTKFLVDNFKSANIKRIVLLEGGVKYQQEKQSFSMNPGDRLTDNRLTKDIFIDQIEVDRYSNWANGKVYLDNYTLSELTFMMEQWYNVKFSFSKNALMSYHFTGVINKNEPLDYNLKIIALTNKVKFQKNEYGVIIEENE